MSPLLPEALVLEIEKNPQLYGLSPVISSTPIYGGVVHHVWRFETVDGRFFIKIRGTSFSRIDIKCNPLDIQFEARATSILAERLPKYFPQVVYCNQELGLLILSDVIRDGTTLEQMLLQSEVTLETLQLLGSSIRTIHQATESLSITIREPNDDVFCGLKLEHKLGFANHPVLNDAIEELLSNHQERQIIIGDPSPKNIGIQSANGAHRVSFFDLEDVHRGNPVFDVGFLAGHLILHNFTNPPQAAAQVKAFQDSYDLNVRSAKLTKVIAVGTLLYRLNSIVPYCIEFDQDAKRRFWISAWSVLENADFHKIDWEELTLQILSFS